MNPKTMEKLREETIAEVEATLIQHLNFYGSGTIAQGLQMAHEAVKALRMKSASIDASPEGVEESADARQVPDGWKRAYDAFADHFGTPDRVESTISVLIECGRFNENAPAVQDLRRYAELLRLLAAAPKPAVNEQDSVRRLVSALKQLRADHNCTPMNRREADEDADAWAKADALIAEFSAACPEPQSVSGNAGDGKAIELLRAVVNETKLCSDCIAGETCCRPALRDAVEFLAHGAGDNGEKK